MGPLAFDVVGAGQDRALELCHCLLGSCLRELDLLKARNLADFPT